VKHPVTSSIDVCKLSGSMTDATPASVTKVSDVRGVPTNRTGSAPSRASATPSRDAPARYAFTAPIVSSTATTAVITRTGPPTPTASRSASGAGLEPSAGPNTSTLVAATAR
jgi:hypothetical protein